MIVTSRRLQDLIIHIGRNFLSFDFIDHPVVRAERLCCERLRPFVTRPISGSEDPSIGQGRASRPGIFEFPAKHSELLFQVIRHDPGLFDHRSLALNCLIRGKLGVKQRPCLFITTRPNRVLSSPFQILGPITPPR